MNTTMLKTRLGDKVQAISETALTVPASEYLALHSNAMEIVRENLKNQPLTFDLFDIVKSPSGGSTVFSVPGLSGDEAEKELTGIILDYTTPRAYWETADPVEGTPPTCFSPDSIVSCDGKPCSRCCFNDFGSKDGDTNAKACKESVVLFLLRPGSMLPLLVRVPVTSKGLFLKYAMRLISRMTPLTGVVTRITLEKATSKSGKPYALFHFEAVRGLDPEETARAREYGKQFKEILATAQSEIECAQAS